MRKAVWVVAVLLVAIWSLFSVGGYLMLQVFGDWAIVSTPAVTGGDPDATAWLAWGLDFAQDFGLVLLVLFWAFVSLLILALAWIVTRFIRPERAGFEYRER